MRKLTPIQARVGPDGVIAKLEIRRMRTRHGASIDGGADDEALRSINAQAVRGVRKYGECVKRGDTSQLGVIPNLLGYEA